MKNEDSSVKDKNWKTNLLGSQGEEVVYNSLDKVLQKRQGPCAFWHSMNLSHLLRVAKETVKHELEEARTSYPDILDVPLSLKERKLALLLRVDIKAIESQVKADTDKLFAITSTVRVDEV